MKLLEIKTAPEAVQDLYLQARQTRERAYSVYSGYSVGAAVQTREGRVFSGCNVENSSYGATVCAERVAIQKAVSEVGKFQLTAVMVVTDSTPPWPPCGMCRQVIAEFGVVVVQPALGSRPKAEHGTEAKAASGPELIIYLANLEGFFRTFYFRELFPESFDVSHLK